MRGCLSLPFRLLFLALLLLGGYVAWTHRDELRRRIHSWTAESGPPEVSGLGRADRAPAVLKRLEPLGAGRVDSVSLSAPEVASLIAGAVAGRDRGALDSVEVRLAQDDLEVRGRVDTRKLPLSFGPLSGVVRDYERVEIGGSLVFRRSGLAEWQVTRARVRGIPLPRDVVGRVLRRFGAGADDVLPVPLPASIDGLRVAPGRLVLYGRAGARRTP
jgi:hypothetical protein